MTRPEEVIHAVLSGHTMLDNTEIDGLATLLTEAVQGTLRSEGVLSVGEEWVSDEPTPVQQIRMWAADYVHPQLFDTDDDRMAAAARWARFVETGGIPATATVTFDNAAEPVQVDEPVLPEWERNLLAKQAEAERNGVAAANREFDAVEAAARRNNEEGREWALVQLQIAAEQHVGTAWNIRMAATAGEDLDTATPALIAEWRAKANEVDADARAFAKSAVWLAEQIGGDGLRDWQRDLLDRLGESRRAQDAINVGDITATALKATPVIDLVDEHDDEPQHLTGEAAPAGITVTT
jgi:hypothetical protein